MKNYKLPTMDRIPSGTLMERLKWVDFGGALLFFMGNTFLCTTLILGGNTHDWSDPLVLSLIALAIVSYSSLIVYEYYIPLNPLVSRHLFSNRTVVLGCVGMWLLSLVFGGTNIAMPQYYMVTFLYVLSSITHTQNDTSISLLGRTWVLYKQNRLMHHGLHNWKCLWILSGGTWIYTAIHKGSISQDSCCIYIHCCCWNCYHVLLDVTTCPVYHRLGNMGIGRHIPRILHGKHESDTPKLSFQSRYVDPILPKKR